jgi:hypothetical protein
MNAVGWWVHVAHRRNADASRRIVATRILVFDFEFFIGVWYSDTAI